MVHIIHQLAGRIRLRIDGLRRSDSLCDFLEREVGRQAGIQEVSANVITGTLLVRFDPRQSTQRVMTGVSDALHRKEDGPGPTPDATRPTPGTGPQPASRHAKETKPPFLPGAPLPWHRLTSEKILSLTDTSVESGLGETSVIDRRGVYGENVLPGAAVRSSAAIVKNQFFSTPVLLTSGAAVLSFVTGRIWGGVFGLVVALVNAAIGSMMEIRAETAIKGAREATNLRTTVLRNKRLQNIHFEEVVIGDIIHLEPGSRVPVDARVVAATDLGIDESALTGESVPVHKSTGPLAREDISITQRRNMLYRGTLVVEGRGRAVAVAVGGHTVLGRLQRFLGDVAPPEAIMARDFREAASYLVKISSGAGILFMGISVIRGYGILRALRDGLSFVAGVFPSGLSTLSASGLALAYREMRRKHILIRRLRVLGNLSTVEMVCFDKTGTLTQNRMTVTELRAGDQTILAEDKTFTASRKAIDPQKNPDIAWLVTLSVLCNEATMGDDTKPWSVEGSSTEKALVDLARRAGMAPRELRSGYPMVDVVHRTDENPFMMTVHRQKGGRLFTAMKGSALEVLEQCALFRRNGRSHPITEVDVRRIESDNLEMAGKGLRVIGVAYCRGRPGTRQGDCKKDDALCWAGLIGLEDPLRHGARDLIKGLHRAGIRTAVITGDQSLTAQHIGEQLGLSGDAPLQILDSTNINVLESPGLSALPTRAHVFARLNPRQKLQIIQAFQRSGMSVAMVGDGMNDVLALKVADVGIAMGKEGDELARETADLVLEDDDLRSILDGIAWGRTFYLNTGKSLRFLLTTSHADILTELSVKSGLAGQGTGAWQGVWTNLTCLSLAMDPPGSGVMDRPPRGVAEALVPPHEREETVKDAIRLTAVSGAVGCCGHVTHGWGTDATGLFSRSVSINELLYALPCRDRGEGPDRPEPRNRYLDLLLFASVGGYLLPPLLRGIGGPLATLASGLLQTAVLGAGALTSTALMRRRPPAGDP